jgi:Cu/Zn superoxide dismutase
MIRRIPLVLAALLVAGLAGCAMSPPANVAVLTAQLSGAQEVPPTNRPGTGTAEVRYNRDNGELQYTVNYSGLSGPLTGAHIHGPAAPGANAGVVVPFPNAGSPITGTAKITPAQAGDLLAGLYYVNLHTAAHPGGEIRGQLRLKQ